MRDEIPTLRCSFLLLIKRAHITNFTFIGLDIPLFRRSITRIARLFSLRLDYRAKSGKRRLAFGVAAVSVFSTVRS